MKNKKFNKTIIYDDACPLCTWYTGAFIKTGLLPANGRRAFSTASPQLLECIDYARSKNEIPLLDNDTHEVLYGIDALVAIIGQRCPIVRFAGKRWPLNGLLKALYKFISYNRKVVVARGTKSGTVDCTPDFHAGWRLIFMAVFLIFNTLMLFPVYEKIICALPFSTISLFGFHAIHLLIVAVNCLLACAMQRTQAIEYLGQVNMLALITMLLLAPLMLLNRLLGYIDWLNFLYLAGVMALAGREYFRRMQYAGILQGHKAVVWINCTCILSLIASLFIL